MNIKHIHIVGRHAPTYAVICGNCGEDHPFDSDTCPNCGLGDGQSE